MKYLRSHLTFTRSQRDGILLLMLVNILLLGLLLFVDIAKPPVFDLTSPDIVKIQRQIDSLKASRQQQESPKLFPFNPNFITDFKAYTLGMSPTQFDRLQKFRDNGQWINSAAEFKEVTGVSDSLLEAISPLFKFPDWVKNAKPRTASGHTASYTFKEKLDLNTASAEDLRSVSGIGDILSLRIIKYRQKLGGFSGDIQLYEVYGLSDKAIDNLLKQFTVKSPKPLEKHNLNTASASDIATIPGIGFELAKDIWEFVRLREGIDDLAELQKIEGLTEHKLRLIALYLYAE